MVKASYRRVFAFVSLQQQLQQQQHHGSKGDSSNEPRPLALVSLPWRRGCFLSSRTPPACLNIQRKARGGYLHHEFSRAVHGSSATRQNLELRITDPQRPVRIAIFGEKHDPRVVS